MVVYIPNLLLASCVKVTQNIHWSHYVTNNRQLNLDSYLYLLFKFHVYSLCSLEDGNFTPYQHHRIIYVKIRVFNDLYSPADFVLIRENTGQWKPVFSHILCSRKQQITLPKSYMRGTRFFLFYKKPSEFCSSESFLNNEIF